MPAELKAELERAAKESGRSLTAEVVARLDLSLLADGKSPEALFTAEEANTYASVARKSIPAIVRDRIRVSINRSIVRGLNAADVQLRDLGLESLPSEDLAKIQFELSHELSEAGYKFEWDGGDSIWITYGDDESAPDAPDTEAPPKREIESLKRQQELLVKRIRQG